MFGRKLWTSLWNSYAWPISQSSVVEANISLQVSSKNIDEMLLLLRKELQKSSDSAQEKVDEYRQLLIRTISQCAIQYPAASEG
jgi:hypothetical protein